MGKKNMPPLNIEYALKSGDQFERCGKLGIFDVVNLEELIMTWGTEQNSKFREFGQIGEVVNLKGFHLLLQQRKKIWDQ